MKEQNSPNSQFMTKGGTSSSSGFECSPSWTMRRSKAWGSAMETGESRKNWPGDCCRSDADPWHSTALHFDPRGEQPTQHTPLTHRQTEKKKRNQHHHTHSKHDKPTRSQHRVDKHPKEQAAREGECNLFPV